MLSINSPPRSREAHRKPPRAPREAGKKSYCHEESGHDSNSQAQIGESDKGEQDDAHNCLEGTVLPYGVGIGRRRGVVPGDEGLPEPVREKEAVPEGPEDSHVGIEIEAKGRGRDEAAAASSSASPGIASYRGGNLVLVGALVAVTVVGRYGEVINRACLEI